MKNKGGGVIFFTMSKQFDPCLSVTLCLAVGLLLVVN